MKKYNIGVVTGTRAEYGIMKSLIKRIGETEYYNLCLIVTGMHLDEQYGNTYKEIERDGIEISYKIDMNLKDNSEAGLLMSMSEEIKGFSSVLNTASLDMMILLGDRYEMLIAATAATIFNIPIAHIHGGELTEGLIDEAIRHSITKMSYLHFTATEEYARRVIQLGENPNRVFNVGALGVENISDYQLLERKCLAEKFSDLFLKDYMIVTYHPVTLESESTADCFNELLRAIENRTDYNYIFTYANADANGAVINSMIDEYVSNHSNAIAYKSMGMLGYLSSLKYSTCVIGNSSSGIIEAPSFHIPTVNIGNRQRGRVRAETVIDCQDDYVSINDAIDVALSVDFKEKCMLSGNPYKGESTLETMLEILKTQLDKGIDLNKQFYDIR